MNKTIEKMMCMLHCSSISIMDVIAISAVSILGGWWMLLFLPWAAYSAKQKMKYD
jgi:hypothetical protein